MKKLSPEEIVIVDHFVFFVMRNLHAPTGNEFEKELYDPPKIKRYVDLRGKGIFKQRSGDVYQMDASGVIQSEFWTKQKPFLGALLSVIRGFYQPGSSNVEADIKEITMVFLQKPAHVAEGWMAVGLHFLDWIGLIGINTPFFLSGKITINRTAYLADEGLDVYVESLWARTVSPFSISLDRDSSGGKNDEKVLPGNGGYVDLGRIDALKGIRSEASFDYSRLIKLCEELNDNWARRNYYSCAFLIKAICHHIPPIFKKKNYLEVVSYFNEMSIQAQSRIIEKLSPLAGDLYSHAQIRGAEDHPTSTAIDQRQALDNLLGEIIRLNSGS